MTLDQEELISGLHQINEYDFEQVIADLWERQGWSTEVTQESNDKGIDVIAERDEPFDHKHVIQAKKYEPSNAVGCPEIQQYASLRQQIDNVDAVVIITTGRFTSNAKEAADELNVKLINGEKLYKIFNSCKAFDILYSYTSQDLANQESSSEFSYDSRNQRSEPSYQDTAAQDFLTDRLLQSTYNNTGYTHQPPQSYLEEDEKPSFAFYSSIKGYTVEFSDGAEDKYRPDPGFGSLYLLTPSRVLIITGLREGDVKKDISLPADADFSIGRLKNRITISTGSIISSKKYHLWIDKEFDEIEIRAAVKFINSPQSGSNISTSDKNDPFKQNEDTLNDVSNMTDTSPQQIVQNANGSFSTKVLTKTRGRLVDQPLIDYLSPHEKLEYVFWHRNKGFRITYPDGSEETPHHDTSQGARFLLVTDSRICYVAGLDNQDESMTFTYDEIDAVIEPTTLRKNLKFTTVDGTDYKFSEIGTHADDVSSAIKYIRTCVWELT